jgi:hypothetical protein
MAFKSYDAEKRGKTMIDLTEQQRQELGKEQPPRFRDPQTNETYVLIKTAIIDNFRHFLVKENDDLDRNQVAILVERAMQEEDEGDPTLAFYQQKYGRQP